jgi:SAM-dependent methyltransferase
VNWRQPDASPDAIERDVAYAIKIGAEYVELLQTLGVELRGASILELGPGHNYGPVLVLACHGARVIVADRYRVPWFDGYHDKFYALLRQRLAAAHPNVDTSAIQRCVAIASTAQAVAVCDSPAENLTGLLNESIDVILSNAVLEHVQKPDRAAAELHRVTRPGGIGIHQIDFRDHRDFSRPLEYLLLEEREFEGMFAARHGECGRQTRHFEMSQFFCDAGFDVAEFDANWIAPDEYLDDFVPRLKQSSSIYKSMSRNELRVISGRFILRKPANR